MCQAEHSVLVQTYFKYGTSIKNVTDIYQFSPEKKFHLHVIYSFLWSKHSLYNIELLDFTGRIIHIMLHYFIAFLPTSLPTKLSIFTKHHSCDPHPPNVATTSLMEKAICDTSLSEMNSRLSNTFSLDTVMCFVFICFLTFSLGCEQTSNKPVHMIWS